MTKTNSPLKNGFFFIIMLIATVGFTQNSPCLDRKTTGYTVAEISSAYKAGSFNCDQKQHAVDVAAVIQADADAQGVKFKPEFGGGPAKFDGTQPGIMDSILKYSVESDGNFVSNYGWDSEVGKHTIYSRDKYSGEKGIYFDYNRTPYFEGNYKPARYSSNICGNIQPGEKQTAAAKTTKTVSEDGNTTTTVTTEKTPDGDVNVTVINTNTNTNTNTNSLPATPPSNMLPTQSYTPGSSYCVTDGQYYPPSNSQGGYCMVDNKPTWIDWANLFLNAVDLGVDIWTLIKTMQIEEDLAGLSVPQTIVNNYYDIQYTYNYNYGEDTDGDGDPDLPDNGPDLPDNGTPDLGENGKLASQSGKTSSPFGGSNGSVKAETTFNQNAGNIFGAGTSVPSAGINTNAVLNDGITSVTPLNTAVAGNIFGGSVSTGSPIVDVNQNVIAGNIFGAGVSIPNTGISAGTILNNGIASVVPLNTSTGVSNPFGGASVAVVEIGNLSGLQTGGITGIQNPVNISANQIVLNPSTGLPITNMVGQNGAIAVNGVPGTNGIQMVNTGTGVSTSQGVGIQPIQTSGVAVNGNIDGNGIKPITLIEQPTTATNIGFNGNQGGVDKGIVANQQYSIGTILSGGATTTGTNGGLILNNTGNTGKKVSLSSVGTGKGIKIK